MSTLYIDRQGTHLTVHSGVLHITSSDGISDRRLPLKYLERVVLRSETELSSKVLCSLAESGVSLLALGGRGGQQIAQITGSAHKDAKRRWQQVLTLSQENMCADIATSLVLAKVRRQRDTLQKILTHRPDIRKPLHDGLQRLNKMLEGLRQNDQKNLRKIDQIRGLEGAAAAMYFEAFFRAFAPTLGADGRNRRPPRDPVNAVLSLSYTLLYAQATTACLAAGLDPALGALHTISHGRAALACDIMEPFRPQVDFWIWQQFRDGLLRPEHFGLDGSGACLLGKAGRAHFYSAWEAHAPHQQRSLTRYARSLAGSMGKLSEPGQWAHLETEGED